jgi:hypothetical protein
MRARTKGLFWGLWAKNAISDKIAWVKTAHYIISIHMGTTKWLILNCIVATPPEPTRLREGVATTV